MAKKANADVLAYPMLYYTPYMLQDAKVIDPLKQRAELTRLVAIARKRQARLRASEFSESYAATVTIPKMSEIPMPGTPGANRAIARALADVALFIRARSSTVSGAREQVSERVQTLEQTFAPGIAEGNELIDFRSFNEKDWRDFGSYMWALKRDGRTSEGADSERAVRTYFEVRRLGGTVKAAKDAYEKWAQESDKLLSAIREGGISKKQKSASTLAGMLGISLE